MITSDGVPRRGRDEPLARALERQRLAHRQHRLQLVVRLLRERAELHTAAHGSAPKPLSDAIRGFAMEMADVRGRLRDLDGRRS